MWSLPVSKSLFTFDKPKRREKMKRRKGKRKIKILLF